MSVTGDERSSPASGAKRSSMPSAGSAKKRPKTAANVGGNATQNNSPTENLPSKPDGWESMDLYKSFLLSGEKFELNDHIFVNSKERLEDGTEDHDVAIHTIDETDYTLWVAAVIEVRAQTPWNVWLRVQWFYRPDELPRRRQPYHGEREIIKSEVQDIISAHTVAGHADVTYWDEMDDSKDVDGIDGLFWRQTFDPSTGKLSAVQLHCVCRKPYNPDTTMFWCGKCEIWEHDKCLAHAIRKEYLKSLQTPISGKVRNFPGKNVDITISASEENGEVLAYVTEADRTAKQEIESVERSIETVSVKCLKCGSRIK